MCKAGILLSSPAFSYHLALSSVWAAHPVRRHRVRHCKVAVRCIEVLKFCWVQRCKVLHLLDPAVVGGAAIEHTVC